MALDVLAGLVLGLGLLGSLAYELWRVAARGSVSEYDTAGRFVREQIVFYAVGALIVALLLLGWELASAAGLLFVVGIFVYSVALYLPRTYPARQPGMVDNLEALWFMGAVGAAGVLMAVQLMGLTLTPG